MLKIVLLAYSRATGFPKRPGTARIRRRLSHRPERGTTAMRFLTDPIAEFAAAANVLLHNLVWAVEQREKRCQLQHGSAKP